MAKYSNTISGIQIENENTPQISSTGSPSRSGVVRGIQIDGGTPTTSATGTQFKNQKDAQSYAKKQNKYNTINQKAQDEYATKGAYGKIGTAASRGIGGRVAELLTGVGRLGAKALDATGLTGFTDPNSVDYTPILDRNSATSQLAKEQYFKVPDSTPGKAWATAYDVSLMATPGAAAELPAIATKAPKLAGALGLLSGDASVGKGIVSKLAGRNISDIPGKLGYLADTATGLGTNILGGVAQQAIKEGGINKQDVDGIIGGTVLAHGIFSGLPALANGIRKFTQPEQDAVNFIKSNPNKATRVLEDGKTFIKDTLAKSKLKSMFGLSKYGQDVEDDALNVAVTYLPSLQKDGKGLNPKEMYTTIEHDLVGVTKDASNHLRNFGGDVYDANTYLDVAKNQLLKDEIGNAPINPENEYVPFLDEAYQKIQKFIQEKGPRGKEKMSAKEFNDFIHALSTYEFAGNKYGVTKNADDVAVEAMFKRLAREFRQAGRGQITQDLAVAAPAQANKFAMLNSEINSKLNARDIVEAISKDPTTSRQFTDHMVGLLGGLTTGAPGIGYFAGRTLSKLARSSGEDFRFNQATGNPIFTEFGNLRNKLIEDISQGKRSMPKGKLKLSDIINQNK